MVIEHGGKKRKMGIHSNSMPYRHSPDMMDYGNVHTPKMSNSYYGDGEGHPANMPQHVKCEMVPGPEVGTTKDYPDTREALHGEQAQVAHQLHRYHAKERY
jgi:hypothetical protein